MIENIISVPEILLPQGVPYASWAVIACDQHTQNREYWQKAARSAGGHPSALNIVLPEIDLLRAQERTPLIHEAMGAYLRDVLTRKVEGFTLVRRTGSDGARGGIVLAVDMEAYDYREGSSCAIRATEGTIRERLPPRVAIRRGAPLECPHVMLLIDDPERTVIEPLLSKTAELAALYDFELMLGGGRLQGWAVDRQGDIDAVTAALGRLAAPDTQAERYGAAFDGHPLLFAVGDGNHSLAAAKALWEEIKAKLAPGEAAQHPARYALVEICNLNDPGLRFEPIHRVLFGAEPDEVLDAFAAYLKENEGGGGTQTFRTVSGGGEAKTSTAKAPDALAVACVQGFLDAYLREHPDASVDYIHGGNEARQLAKRKDAVAFLMPAMDKRELFPSVMRSGALPRKTFSMGEARDKRYYLECRRITEK